MTEDDAIQATADNLRADFLNADSNWARWKVFNRALDWAATATKKADAAWHAVQEREKQYEAWMKANADTATRPVTVTVGVDADDVRLGRQTLHSGGVVRPRTAPPLMGETGPEVVTPPRVNR